VAEYQRIRNDQGDFWPNNAFRVLDEEGSVLIDLIDEYDRHRYVSFDRYFAYRKTDESFLYITVELLAHTVENRHWLYKFGDSQFLSWFNEESDGIYSAEANHYAIVTSNAIIDVIAKTEPEIKTSI
jgi:hypothetical protein